MKDLKLTIELVPETSWFNNLRSQMTRRDWDKIRKQTYENYNCKCAICGSEGRMNCHEVWEYDDIKFKQTLLGFIALCDMCHHVKHIGLANILANKGRLDYEMVIAHFTKVNNCDRKTFEKHREKAYEVWEKRSSYQWNVDLGEYADLILQKEEKE
jgi:hypothetical protein